TTSVPEALSNSYLIGSPPSGTSVTTLTSSGGFVPIFIASRRIKKLQWRKGGRSANGRGDEAEGDARQHVIVEALFRAANRHAPESATKGKRFLIVGERPNDCGAVAVFGEFLAPGVEQAATESETLILRQEIDFENFAGIRHQGN